MIKEMVIVLSAANTAALGSLRTFPGLLAATDDNYIWLRGISPEENDSRFLQLPAIYTYLLDTQGRLFEKGALTPKAVLPALSWQTLVSMIKVTLPVSALPGELQQLHRVKLMRSHIVLESVAILTTLDAWEAYVITAPLVRLQNFHFAVSEKGNVLVLGEPLLPLPGEAYSFRHRILLPVGFDFDPPVIAELVAAELNPHNDGLLLFHKNGDWEKISLQSFVPATRSAVRLTNSTF